MALSNEAKRRLKVALTDEAVGNEVAAAIDAPGDGPAALVAAIAPSTNLPAAACAGGAAPTAAQVNTAIDTVAAVAEARLDALEAKVNELVAKLKAASYVASA
jgi:hypothetical protein